MVYQWQRLWLKMDLSEKDWGARVDFKLTLGPPMCVGSVNMLKNIWNSPWRGSLPLKCIPSHGLMPSQDMVQILLPSHGFLREWPPQKHEFLIVWDISHSKMTTYPLMVLREWPPPKHEFLVDLDINPSKINTLSWFWGSDPFTICLVGNCSKDGTLKLKKSASNK